MPTPTIQELYDATLTAIYEVTLNGQHIGSEGRTWTRANLDELRTLKKELAAELRSTTTISDRILYGVKRRT